MYRTFDADSAFQRCVVVVVASFTIFIIVDLASQPAVLVLVSSTLCVGTSGPRTRTEKAEAVEPDEKTRNGHGDSAAAAETRVPESGNRGEDRIRRAALAAPQTSPVRDVADKVGSCGI